MGTSAVRWEVGISKGREKPDPWIWGLTLSLLLGLSVKVFLELAIYIVFKWKVNFLCKLYTLSAGRKEVILITGEIQAQAFAAPREGITAREQTGPLTPLFSPPVVPYSIFPHPHVRYGTAVGQILGLYASRSPPKTTDPEHWMRPRWFGRDRMGSIHSRGYHGPSAHGKNLRLQRLPKLWLFLISCLALWPKALERVCTCICM